MLTRKKILEQAVHDCFKEMYAKAQPSADWDEIVKEFKEGKRDKDERVYEQHYLSQDEYLYIKDKYLDAYNIRGTWRDNVEVVEEYLSKGGLKDKCINSYVDDNGIYHSSEKGTEKVLPIVDQIKNAVKSYFVGYDNIQNEISQKLAYIVLNTVKTCKDFYRFDMEESQFNITVALGASPTSNPETVKKYWKEKTGEDIEIEERNPKLFWYKDMGYTDEDLAYEFEDYGENWKEALDKEWKDELEERKRKHLEIQQRINENIEKYKDNNEQK